MDSWDGYTIYWPDMHGPIGKAIPGFTWLMVESDRLRDRLGLEPGYDDDRRMVPYETVDRLREEGYTIGSET